MIKRTGKRGMNPFDQLLVPLFPSICEYLSLLDKCLVFPVLSKAINRMFDMKRCCRNDMSINLSDNRTSIHPNIRSNTVQQLRYAPYAQGMSLVIGQLAKRYENATQLVVESKKTPSEFFDELVRHVTQSLIKCSLSSLCIKEDYEYGYQMIWTRIIAALAGANSSAMQNIGHPLDSLSTSDTSFGLRELRLEITGAQDFNWAGLKLCSRLALIHIQVTPAIASANIFESSDSLFLSLPDSIEDIVLRADGDSVLSLTWTAALLSDTFAPNLKRFSVQRHVGYNKAIVQAILKTTMVQTGAIRPIDMWRNLDGQHLVQQLPLKHLTIHCFSNDLGADAFACSYAWPQLQSVRAAIVNSGSNVNSLLTLLSRRPIAELDLCCARESSPLDNQSVLALGSLSSLVCLKLAFTSTPPFVRLSTGCWPQLEVLELETSAITEDEMSAVLKAAPSCKQICVEVTSLSPTLVLAMIGCFCPLVVRIDIQPYTTSSNQHAAGVRAMFERYPARSGLFVHLVHLAMRVDHCCHAALHYLLRLLSAAPQLRWVSLSSLPNDMLSLVMLRALPHLVTLPNLVTMGDRKLINRCVECKRREVSIIDTFFLRHEHHMSLRRATAHDDIANEWFGGQQVYPVFAGNSGRRIFFDTICLRMSSSEQQSLQHWDASDYSHCCSADPTPVKRSFCCW